MSVTVTLFGQKKGDRVPSDIAGEFARVVIADVFSQPEVQQSLKINVDALRKDLETILRRIYRQAFLAIAHNIIGKVHHPDGVWNLHSAGMQGELERFMTGLSALTRTKDTDNFRGIVRGRMSTPGSRRGAMTAYKTLLENTHRAPPSVTVNWAPLSPHTIKRKGKSNEANMNVFFRESGDLQQVFKHIANNADTYLNNLGRLVSIRYKNSAENPITDLRGRGSKKRDPLTGRFAKRVEELRGVVPGDQVEIVIFPDVPPSMILSITNGSDPGMVLERKLGFDKIQNMSASYRKNQADFLSRLGNFGKNSNRAHRPLVQPVFTYYTRYEAPRIINEFLARRTHRWRV